MPKKDKKFCIACLEEGKIRQWYTNCFDLEHRTRYKGKSETIEHFNTLIDEKIAELFSVRDLLIDVYKMAQK